MVFAPPTKRASNFQDGPESLLGNDMAFLKEIQDLAEEILETTEKAIVLQKVWGKESKLSGKLPFYRY